MRVVLFAPAVPPVVGGAETTVEMLAFELLRAGVDLCLITGNAPRSALLETMRRSDGCIEVLPACPPTEAVGWEWMAFSRAEALHNHVKRHPADVVHCFSHDTALAAAIALRPGRPPVVATFSEIATGDTAFGALRTAFVHDRLNADFVVASEYFRNAVERSGVSAERIHKIMVGVDVHRWNTGKGEYGRELLGVRPGTPVIVCPSRFSPRKGQRDLVHALALLRERPYHMIFTGSVNSGSPAYLDEVHAAVSRLGLGDRVDFRLEEDREVLPHILAAADVVVQPSHYEGLGTAALEAMAAGSCVLLTQTSGFVEIAEHDVSAWFVTPRDPQSLANGLATLLTDINRRQRLAVAGQVHVSRQFDIRTTARRLLEVYGSLTADPTPQSPDPGEPDD